MYRRVSGSLAVCLLTLLISLSIANAQDSAVATPTSVTSSKNEAKAMKWKERILKVPVGSYVKGKLENHQEFEGQLREISDGSFSVQCLKGNKIETISIPYEEMKSLSVAGKPSTGEKVAKTLLSF